jgi:serine/threonine-protein kinase RsbW
MAGCKSGKMEHTQITLESNLQSVDQAEEIAIQEAAKARFSEDEQSQIGMAVRECVVNAVVHGNRYNRNKKVHLDIEHPEGALSITVGDEGEGFDPSSLPDPLAPENLLRQSGRGLLLIRSFMDEVNFSPRPGGGTAVRLIKKSGNQ